MSKAFQSLFKVSLLQSFDFRKTEKAKNISLFIPILLVFLLGCFLSGFYAYIFSDFLIIAGEENQLNLVLYGMAGIASIVGFISGITKVKGFLFGGNDYDMLASMPISKKSIIFVKFFSLYLVEFFYTFIFVVPATIVISVLGKSALWLFDGLLLVFFVPILPLFLAGIAGVMIGFISDRFRFGNIITILFYILFLGMILYMSYLFNTTDAEAEQGIESILLMLKICGWMNPSTKLFMLPYVILPHLLFVLGNAIILFIMVFVFAGCYDYFHIVMNSEKSHQIYVEKKAKQKSVFKAIFVMDIKRYFSSKAYLLNTITGGILCVVMTIIMISSFQAVKDPYAYIVLKEISPYFVLIILWCAGMALPTAAAISIEGKNFWQVKTLPISYKQYSVSKILLTEMVMAPFVLIGSIVLAVFVEKTFLNLFIVFVLPQLYLFGMNCLAYFVNLHFYKLNWTNETQAAKNSIGVVLSMLLDFAYTIVLCIVFILPGVYGYFMVGALLSLAITIAVAITFYTLVMKHCSKAITKIEI